MKFLSNPELKTILPEFKGNKYKNGKFRNEEARQQPGFKDIIKWQFGKKPLKKEKKKDTFRLNCYRNNNFLSVKDDAITWLGHAAFFIRLGGKNILTDPCLKSLPMIPRLVDIPCDIQEFQTIDYILLSHTHRDHLDVGSLNILLKNNPKAIILAPLKTGRIIRTFNKTVDIQEAGWWQEFNLDSANLKITFLPARHWNRRGPFDFNRELWGSFSLQAPKHHLYFAGDSAKANHFEQISLTLPSIDTAIMPIGAYLPRNIMSASHLTPEEAVEAFHQLKAKKFIPMHYGTFDLSDEPLGDPVRRMNTMQQNDKINGEYVAPAVGELCYL